MREQCLNEQDFPDPYLQVPHLRAIEFACLWDIVLQQTCELLVKSTIGNVERVKYTTIATDIHILVKNQFVFLFNLMKADGQWHHLHLTVGSDQIPVNETTR